MSRIDKGPIEKEPAGPPPPQHARLVRGARRRITEQRLSAESAVTEEAEEIAGAILASADPAAAEDERASIARRADEIREISRRLVRNLTRKPFRSFAGLPEGGV